MNHSFAELEDRIVTLERTVRRTRLVAGVALLSTLLPLGAGFLHSRNAASDEVRTRRLVVVDDDEQTRVLLGQDPANTQRIARSAGLWLFDDKGSERGGLSTMADGSVVLGLDAPVGVGAPMSDRVGLKVFPNGSAYIMLIDNKTGAVARLVSEEAPGGVRGLQLFKWERDNSRHYTRTITFDGDVRDTIVR